MADALAVARATTSTAKMGSAMKRMWDERKHLKAVGNETGSFDMVLRGQIDEVFLVLAHLGEAILPLGVFNKDYYLQTLGDVQAAVSSCGNEMLLLAWSELDAELQYVCTAGMAFCACYAPMPVYRGFGACVLSDYDWACPDMAYLEEKAKKKALWTVYGVKQRVDPQPTKSVFLAFDQAIQLLQVKPLAFLEKRPIVSTFAEHQPRYGAKSKREVKDNHDLLEDWVDRIEKHGHPGLTGSRNTSWGIPFATWTSQYSCHIVKTAKDTEIVAYHQMDPGRLLHGFLSRGNANLAEGQVLLLMPGSPAESLLAWLEGLPGMSHKIVRWEDLDTDTFESKISKSMRKKIGKYPLPTQFAVRDRNAGAKSPANGTASQPSVLEHPNTVSPPPYSRGEKANKPPTAELGLPDPREMPATPVGRPGTAPGSTAVIKMPKQMPALPEGIARMGAAAGLKSIHTLRRMQSGTPPAAANTSTPNLPAVPREAAAAGSVVDHEAESQPDAAELPSSPAVVEAPAIPAKQAVELPTEFQKEAPKPLATKASNSGLNKDAQIARKPIVIVEPPSDETDKGKDTSETQSPIPATLRVGHMPPVGSEKKEKGSNDSATTNSPADEYLDLLNQVAKGDLAPEALKELLHSKGLLKV